MEGKALLCQAGTAGTLVQVVKEAEALGWNLNLFAEWFV